MRALSRRPPARAMRFFSSATCFLAARRSGGLTQCVRALIGEGGADEALRAAETWVRTPEDDNRRAALWIANDSDRRKPTTWLAFAAGWSGGSLLPADQKPVPPPARGMRDGGEHGDHAGGRRRRSARRDTRMVACAEAGVRFASGGEPTVLGLEAASQ